MTQITHDSDGQTLFDGMTAGEFIEAFDAFAFFYNKHPMIPAAYQVLRHLSARVDELEGRPLTMDGFTDADIAALEDKP